MYRTRHAQARQSSVCARNSEGTARSRSLAAPRTSVSPPLALSPRPDSRSRALFTDDQVDIDIDLLERGQQVDGGWTFDWLAWPPGQSIEWRGSLTVRALATGAGHGRPRPRRSACWDTSGPQ